LTPVATPASAVEAATRLGALPFLVIAVGFGLVAYFVSRSYRHRHGVTPWNIPSWAWGLIGFFSLLLWAILILIAINTTKKPQAQWQGQAPYPPYPPGAPPYGPPPGTPPDGAAPGTPYGAAPGAAAYGAAPGTPAPSSGPPPYPTASPLPPPGWYPEPSGRHQSRYWDGTTWTEHVGDGAATSTDPV
jgi:hypothetical protein